MTQSAFDSSTRFFRSFTTHTMPIVPVDEVAVDDIEQLASFYAVDFDEKGRLARCRKFLHIEEDAVGLSLEFDDNYTYAPNGNVESRTLIRADGRESRWFFSERDNDAGWHDISMAHSQLTEVESGLMADVLATDVLDNAFSVSSVGRYLTSVEQVLRTATQDPGSDILLLTPGSESNWDSMFPPDAFENSLADLAMVLKPVLLENELPLLYPNADSFSERDRAFADHGIRALAAYPVRVNVNGPTAFGVIAMLARHDWTETVSGQILSLLQRIAVFVELLMEFGRRDSPIPQT